MQYSSNIQKEIIKKYLDKTFIKELHSMHPYDVFKRYGGFVAADYSSGGCASAFYAGLYKKDTFESNRETNLSREINASYTWDDNSTSGNLKIGRGGKSNLSITGTFSSVLVSVKTLGGNASGGCSMPQEVGNSSVDLSSWISSLSDKSTDVIADFNQNGLIPISEFILERNLRNSLNFYINNEPNNTPSIGAPYILVFEYGSLNNPPAKIYAAWLMTRYGENLDLNKVKVVNTNIDNAEFWQWIDDLASIFQIKIFNLTKIQQRSNNELAYGGTNYKNLIPHSLDYKVISKDGVLYFVDEVDKVGFSILDNPQMIKEYGLTNYLSKLSKSSLTYDDLVNENYMINAL